MLASVRVRGIYATALSWLLYRKGFLLSDVSDVLKSRLPVPPAERPPDVTVKAIEGDPDHILVIGYPWEAGEAVAEAISEELPFVTRRKGRLGLYTVVDVEVGADCRGVIDGVVVRVEGCEGPGLVRASIVREALEPGAEAVARPGARVVGSYVIVSSPGEGFSFSEHVRGLEKRAELIAAVSPRLEGRRVHVHFRSSTRTAPPEAVAAEAERLAAEAEALASQGASSPGVVRRGEFIAILGFPRPAKERLDEVRREIVPTIDGHHSLKSFGDRESRMVECAEDAVRAGARITGGHIVYHLARASVSRPVVVDHVKPTGEKIRLGPFTLESVSGEPGKLELRLRRIFTRPGVLDGLGVEKRPGDEAKTIVREGEWYIIHEYLSSSGQLLGVYANVNTPVEVGDGRIKYFDLYVDVVKKPGEPAKIIDAGELERAYEEGVIPRDLRDKALEVASYLERKLNSTYP